MRRGVRNVLVAGWVVLAAGGWGLTRWLGEPVAIDGPTPGTVRTPNPVSGGGPGPQPEHECDGASRASSLSPAVSPFPTATAVPDGGVARRSIRFCTRLEAKSRPDPNGD
ncbi:hypothetical protein P6B95_28575 [Streptomyces atratus]|uniref:hypothetical protein n=1 Tax=Streptomyces atratus TaxID=1893 RepID=UPI002AC36621|nr:hypothetical protein [Streptomyces atratus]WPW30943.1 hypothetical protein P6B95_28575 [Streptomyces atratus]